MTRVARRAVLAGLASAAFASGGVNRRNRALAAGNAPETVSLTTASGHKISAALSLPEALPAPAVIAIHGFLGMSDWYRSRAQAFADEGFVGLSVDLYDGKSTTDLNVGSALMGEANKNKARTMEILSAWADWLRRDGRTNDKIAFVGWSFGADWALPAALDTQADGVVLYYGLTYGRILKTDSEIDELRRLKGPVLGLFAENDSSVTKRQADQFAQEMKAAGKTLEVHWYAAAHGFANPMLPGYNKQAADQAWSDTATFLRALA